MPGLFSVYKASNHWLLHFRRPGSIPKYSCQTDIQGNIDDMFGTVMKQWCCLSWDKVTLLIFFLNIDVSQTASPQRNISVKINIYLKLNVNPKLSVILMFHKPPVPRQIFIISQANIHLSIYWWESKIYICCVKFCSKCWYLTDHLHVHVQCEPGMLHVHVHVYYYEARTPSVAKSCGQYM